jgi:nonsense-mediated mRNA decay protein 3
MKKVKGLRRVIVSDAAWVWTEPHSMRLKVRLTVQKEVYNGAVLQQLIGVEFVVRNLQCLDCQQMFASMASSRVSTKTNVSESRLGVLATLARNAFEKHWC